MKKIVSFQEMEAIDRFAQQSYAMPQLMLMENAGRSAWHSFLEKTAARQYQNIVFLCGKAHNGGDALVMARHAHYAGFTKLHIIHTEKDESKLSLSNKINLNILQALGISCRYSQNILAEQANISCIEHANFIVDGLLGTGTKGMLYGNMAAITDLVNRCRKSVLENSTSASSKKIHLTSLDIPSGLYESICLADLADASFMKSDLTLCFGFFKEILFRPLLFEFAGECILLSSVFPPIQLQTSADWQSSAEGKKNLNPKPAPLRLIEIQDLEENLPKLSKTDYKKTRGHAAIAGGSKQFLGAPILATLAASRSFSGLCTRYAADDVFATQSTALASEMLASVEAAQPHHFKKHQALLIGPGVGPNDNNMRLFLSFTKKALAACLSRQLSLAAPPILVFDAEGIDIYKTIFMQAQASKKKTTLSCGQAIILTPHIGEFSRLIQKPKEEILLNPLVHVRKAAQKFHCCLCLKGHVNYIVAANGTAFLVEGANPLLGIAGSGDVLAGLTCSLAAYLLAKKSGGLDSQDDFIHSQGHHNSLSTKMTQADIDTIACNAMWMSCLLHQQAGKQALANKSMLDSHMLIDILSGLVASFLLTK